MFIHTVEDWEVEYVAHLLEDLYVTKVQSGSANKLVWYPLPKGF